MSHGWGLFLGPDKAGSSWLQQLLEWHPEVAVPSAKELFYFDRYYDRGWDWYRSRFPVDQRTTVAVEVCHDYLFSEEAADRIRADLPDATLLVSARDPVARARSAHRYMVRQGRTSADLSTALRTIPELVDHGRYGAHVARYLERFDRRQIHVLDFDVLRTDPERYARRVFEVLGVEQPEAVPEEVLAPVRTAAVARAQWLATLGKRLAVALRAARLEGLVGRLKSSPAIERALFRSTRGEDHDELDAADRSYLRSGLEEDSRLLDELLGTGYSPRWWG